MMTLDAHRARLASRAQTSCKVGAALLAVSLSFLLGGCGGDGENPFVLIPYVPPAEGSDQDMAADGGVVRPVDPFFEDRPRCESSAEACLLPGAVGACVNGRCSLVVCELGRGDCDGDPTNGCEVDLTISSSCGSCFETCSEQQTCQRSVTGFACSVGVVCEAERFDLDALQETGCEFEALPLEDATIAQPIAFGMAITERVALLPSSNASIEEVAAFRGFIVGFDGEGGRVVQPPGRSDGVFVPLPSTGDLEPFVGHSISLDAIRLGESDGATWPMLAALDVWQDGAYLYRTTPREQGAPQSSAYGPLDVRALDEESMECVEGAVLRPRDGVIRQGATPDEPLAELVTATGLFELSPCEESGASLCPVSESGFHGVDYLRWFYPYADEGALELRGAHAPINQRLSEQEVAACQQCVLDTQTGALRASRVCYADPMDSCGLGPLDACDGVCTSPATSCPDFDVRAVKYSQISERHHVVTRRGVVILRDDGQVWLPLARLESVWDASSVGGGGFLDVASAKVGDHERLFLLHGRGFLRVVDVSLDEPVRIIPAHPDIPLSLGDLDARGPLAFEAIDAHTVLLVSPYQVTIIYLQDNFDHGRAVIELEQDLSSGGFLGGRLVEQGAVIFKQEFGLTSALFTGRR